MRSETRIQMLLVVGALLAVAATAVAFPRLSETTQKSCATCHTGVAGGPELNDAGKAFKADSTKVPGANVEGATYVGSGKCKMCHAKEYKSWQATAHAKGLETLRAASAERVKEISGKLGVQVSGAAAQAKACLTCHVTGHGQPGGYPAADSLKTVALSGVTCENCHGPSSKHVAAAKDAKKAATNEQLGERFCRDCHTPAMSPKFDFATYQAKGLHEMKAAE